MQTNPVFLPGQSRQRSLEGYSPRESQTVRHNWLTLSLTLLINCPLSSPNGELSTHITYNCPDGTHPDSHNPLPDTRQHVLTAHSVLSSVDPKIKSKLSLRAQHLVKETHKHLRVAWSNWDSNPSALDWCSFLYTALLGGHGETITQCFWQGDPCGVHFCPICSQGRIMKTKIKKKNKPQTLLFVLKIVESE